MMWKFGNLVFFLDVDENGDVKDSRILIWRIFIWRIFLCVGVDVCWFVNWCRLRLFCVVVFS